MEQEIPAFGQFPPTIFQRMCQSAGRRLPDNYLGRRIAGWIRFAVMKSARRPADIIVFKQRMRLRLGDNACERRLLITPQWFDPAELDILSKAIRPSFCFVDLGANVGTYAIFVATRAVPTRVIAIEPHPLLIPRLRENIALNGANITVCPFAVSDAPGLVIFSSGTSNLGISSIHPLEERKPSDQITVRARTLLEIVQAEALVRIDAMKADIEGVEDRALLPFFATAPRSLWPQLLIIENNRHRWRQDCVAFMIRNKYRIVHEGANVVLSLA